MAEVTHTLSPIVAPYRAPCPSLTRVDFPSPTGISHLEFREAQPPVLTFDCRFVTFDAKCVVLFERNACDFAGNFYAATIAVDAYYTEEKVPTSASVPWHPLVPQVALMEDPHCEHDAQKWHRLLLNRDGLPSRELLALRITLTQP